jgi:hypothetical protein
MSTPGSVGYKMWAVLATVHTHVLVLRNILVGEIELIHVERYKSNRIHRICVEWFKGELSMPPVPA